MFRKDKIFEDGKFVEVIIKYKTKKKLNELWKRLMDDTEEGKQITSYDILIDSMIDNLNDELDKV